MQSTMMSVPLNLSHFLERAGKLFGAQEIVSRMPDKSLHRYTYADFYRRARLLAEALTKAGLKRGDRVATLMWNHYAHYETYFGAIVAGGVLHTLNLRLAPDDIAFIANHAQDRFLIVDDVLLPLFEQFRHKVDIERVIVVPLTGKPVAGRHAGLRGVPENGERALRLPGDGRERGVRHVLHLGHHRQAQGRGLFAPLAGPAFAGAGDAGRRGDVGTRRAPAGRADVPCQRLGRAVHGCDARLQDGVSRPAPASRRPHPAARERAGHPLLRGAHDLAADGADPGEEPGQVEAASRACA